MKNDFTIIMANHNNGKYISDAINSVLTQTYNNLELIIIDDYSVDNSTQIIKTFLKDQRINFLKNNKNMGYIFTLKKMIDLSNSNIIGILDSDDILKKTAIEDVLKIYKKNNNIGFVYTQFECCDQNMRSIKKGYCKPIFPSKSNLELDVVSHFKTFKKDIYYKTEGYSEDILYAEDKDLVFKMEEVCKMFFLNKILYKHRQLPTSQGNDTGKSFIRTISFIKARVNAYNRRKKEKTFIPNISFLKLWSSNLIIFFKRYIKKQF